MGSRASVTVVLEAEVVICPPVPSIVRISESKSISIVPLSPLTSNLLLLETVLYNAYYISYVISIMPSIASTESVAEPFT